MKIALVYIGKPQWEAGWPFLGYDNVPLMEKTNEYLTRTFPTFKFVPLGPIMKYEPDAIQSVKETVQGADGLVLCTIGLYGDPGIIQAGLELLEIGKPAILFNYIFAGDHSFIKIYTLAKTKHLPVVPVSSHSIESIAGFLTTLGNFARLRGKKILVSALDESKVNWDGLLQLVGPEQKKIVKDAPGFVARVGELMNAKSEFFIDLKGTDQAHQWRKDEARYQQILSDVFNVELDKVDPAKIAEYYNRVDEKDAKPIAEKWTREAQVVEPSPQTVLNAARLHLAMKRLLADHEADAFAPDCGTLLLTGFMPAYPCMGFFELPGEGCLGICESDLDSTISALFGYCVTGGRPGFVSNHALDLTENQVIYLHCVAPHLLYGIDGKTVPYEIWHHGETHFLGASPHVTFPAGETVTTIKISAFNKKIAIRTGTIIDNVKDERGCVSKMLVRSDARKILENYDWDTFGWHRVTFIGDWKEQFMMAAKWLGLEVVEEDI